MLVTGIRIQLKRSKSATWPRVLYKTEIVCTGKRDFISILHFHAESQYLVDVIRSFSPIWRPPSYLSFGLSSCFSSSSSLFSVSLCYKESSHVLNRFFSCPVFKAFCGCEHKGINVCTSSGRFQMYWWLSHRWLRHGVLPSHKHLTTSVDSEGQFCKTITHFLSCWSH